MIEPYCLYCHHPLRKEKRDCPRCAKPVRERLYKRFWSRAPALLRTQRALQLVNVLLFVFLTCGVFPHLGPGSRGGTMLAAPLFFLLAVDATITRLTRKRQLFRPALFWGLFFLLSGLLMIYIAHEGHAPYFIAPLLLALSAATFLWFPRLFERWKRKTIAAGRPVVSTASGENAVIPPPLSPPAPMSPGR